MGLLYLCLVSSQIALYQQRNGSILMQCNLSSSQILLFTTFLTIFIPCCHSFALYVINFLHLLFPQKLAPTHLFVTHPAFLFHPTHVSIVLPLYKFLLIHCVTSSLHKVQIKPFSLIFYHLMLNIIFIHDLFHVVFFLFFF